MEKAKIENARHCAIKVFTHRTTSSLLEEERSAYNPPEQIQGSQVIAGRLEQCQGGCTRPVQLFCNWFVV